MSKTAQEIDGCETDAEYWHQKYQDAMSKAQGYGGAILLACDALEVGDEVEALTVLKTALNREKNL